MRVRIAFISLALLLGAGLAVVGGPAASADVSPSIGVSGSWIPGQDFAVTVVQLTPSESYTLASAIGSVAPPDQIANQSGQAQFTVSVPGAATAPSITLTITKTGSSDVLATRVVAVRFPIALLEMTPEAPWQMSLVLENFASNEIVDIAYSSDVGGPANTTASSWGYATVPLSVVPGTVPSLTVTAIGRGFHHVATVTVRIPSDHLSAGESVALTQWPPIALVSRAPGFQLRISTGQLSLSGRYGGDVVSPWVSPNPRSDWTSGTVTLRADGNLVLTSPAGAVVWSTGTAGHGVTRAVLQGDGNLVLYTATGKAVWASQAGAMLGSPRSVLTGGNLLSVNQRLVNGKYHAVLQGDGNFVVYGKRVWSTGTVGKPATRLVMQTNSDLVLYSSFALWSSLSTSGSEPRLVMQGDGNLVLYDEAGHARWASGTAR
jgi:hypothetical protein